MSEFKYPKFIVFELAEYGPHIWTFETAHETALHLWGRYLPYLAIFKDRKLVHFESSELDDIEKQLAKEETQ